jgi:uncharacterized phage infection (PIP) family protein YhgE
MKKIAFCGPYVAFFFSALAGIACRKSWTGTLVVSLIFFGAAYIVFGAINSFTEKNNKK